MKSKGNTTSPAELLPTFSPSAFCLHPSSFLQALHSDDNGNIGVLMLLTIWALLGVLAIVWNTGEVAARKQDLQTAADTSAHSSATWLSRSINLITAQNMVICQDASMETIWRAVPPTDQAVRGRLERELAEVENLLNGGNPTGNQLQSRMTRELEGLDNEYAQTIAALGAVSAASGQAFADPKAGQQFLDSVRQANLALGWVQNTYVGGSGPGNAVWPGPPGPGGQGLRQLVEQWSPPTNEAPFLQAIIDSLNQQLAVIDQFESRTAPSEAQPVDQTVAQHEAEVFGNEQEMAQKLTDTIQQQLQKQADFYNVSLTIGTTGRGAQSSGPAQVQAPVINASDVPTQDHYDSIRGENVTIDPMNVQVNDDITGDASIWFPNVQAPTPEEVLAEFPRMQKSFTINCNIPEGWGHLFCPPLYRYFHQRVGSDEQGLQTYMQQIDDLRKQLAVLLRQLRGLGASDNITGLPGQLIDPNPDPQGNNNGRIDVLPRLTAPGGATDQLRSAVTLYNQHGGRYTSAVRTLASALSSWAQQYDRYTQAFAAASWNWHVRVSSDQVLKALGDGKQFMVLAPYQLRPIPDWAQQGMRVSAEAAIRDRIIRDNIGPVSQAIINALAAADPSNAGRGFLDPTAGGNFLRAFYSQQASQIAFEIVSEAASEVAPQIAAEWVSRPWAYEITPPDVQVPPSVGVGKDDRQKYFTLMTAAKPTDQNQPKLFLAKLMDAKPPQLLADAQAETFNWNEFHNNYGGSERFDEVTFGTDAEFVGAPLPWRTGTVGGWNWNARLALTDALSQTVENSGEFGQYFSDAGVSGNDAAAMTTLTLH